MIGELYKFIVIGFASQFANDARCYINQFNCPGFSADSVGQVSHTLEFIQPFSKYHFT